MLSFNKWVFILCCIPATSFDIFGLRLDQFYHVRRKFVDEQQGNSAPPLQSVAVNPSTSQVEEDGFSSKKQHWINKLSSRFRNVEPGTLILVRHGQTTMNYNKTFTGWIDVDLSENGKREVEHAARLLLERGFTVDVTYTSRLKRAIRSSWIILQELGQIYRPVYKSYRLNERMYGSLEGKSKVQSCVDMGEEVVQQFRTGLYARPPAMTPEHPHWHATETKYLDLDPSEIPLTESLQDTMDRALPLLENRIMPDLRAGKTVMVVAHANSIRGILKCIDELSEEQIKKVGIPNGIPLIYRFKVDRKSNALLPIPQSMAVAPLNGEFLEKKNLLRILLQREADLAASVPGFDRELLGMGPSATSIPAEVIEGDMGVKQITDLILKERDVSSDPMAFLSKADGNTGPVDLVIKGLSTLDRDRKLIQQLAEMDIMKGDWTLATTVPMPGSTAKAPTVALTPPAPVASIQPPRITAAQYMTVKQQPLISAAQYWRQQAEHGDEEPPEGLEMGEEGHGGPSIPFLSAISAPSPRRREPRDEPVVVIIRHGKTEYNKLGLFTGWEDVGLAAEGRIQAIAAGKLLKRHGFTFDVVYTSWLSRAIETAWLVLDELDLLWLPIIKSWRLNERMYGALTGLSKQMIAQRHGEKQLKIWRRSYDTRPPPISSFSASYPGNDDRYVSNVLDVRYSVFESLIRSIGHRRFELHRKFPKSESLKDCMQRTIPYFTEKIVPQSIAQGKNVLIASSENAIRGLLMYLCEIPTDRIHEVEIPTGLPLVFNVKKKCIQLLDDGLDDGTKDPLERYDFGTSPELLFRPCDLSVDESCFVPLYGSPYGPGSVRSYAFDPIIRLKASNVTNSNDEEVTKFENFE